MSITCGVKLFYTTIIWSFFQKYYLCACMYMYAKSFVFSVFIHFKAKLPLYQATFTKPAPDSLQVSVTGALRTKVDSSGANVMVALYESGLVTDCPRGENKGRILSNDYVVRKLEKLCTVKDISHKKTVSGTVNFPLWEGFNSSKCGLAVFVQNTSHQIFGSQSFQLPEDIWFRF